MTLFKPGLLAVALLGHASFGAAVQSQSSVSLAPDNPIVIGHFVQFFVSLTSAIRARNAADPQLASSRITGVRQLFGVSADGYAKMETVMSATKARLESVQSAQVAYASSLSKMSKADIADRTLAAYHQELTAILLDVPVQLKAQLSPSDWAGVQRFVSTDLAPRIRVGGLTRAR